MATGKKCFCHRWRSCVQLCELKGNLPDACSARDGGCATRLRVERFLRMRRPVPPVCLAACDVDLKSYMQYFQVAAERPLALSRYQVAVLEVLKMG